MELPVVGHLEPWQGVFIAIGLPGILGGAAGADPGASRREPA